MRYYIINIVLTPLTRSPATARDTRAGQGVAHLITLGTPLLSVFLAVSTLLVFARVVAAVTPVLIAVTEIVNLLTGCASPPHDFRGVSPGLRPDPDVASVRIRCSAVTLVPTGHQVKTVD